MPNMFFPDSHCASVCDAPAEEMQSVIKDVRIILHF